MESPSCPPPRLTSMEGLGIGIAVGFVTASLLLLGTYFRSDIKSVPSLVLKPIRNPFRAIYSRARIFVNLKARRTEAPVIEEYNQPCPSSRYSSLPYFALPLSRSDMRHRMGFIWQVQSWASGCMKEVSASIFDEQELLALAGEPANGGTWSDTIADPRTRKHVLSSFIAQVIYKRIHPTCPPEETLLPIEVSTCYQYLLQPLGTRDDERFRAVWRKMTFLCLRTRYGTNLLLGYDFHDGDPRKERVTAIVSRVFSALRADALINKGTLENCKDTLQFVFEEAANFAFVLFSDHRTWEVSWNNNETDAIISPELRQFLDGEEVTFYKAWYGDRYYDYRDMS